MTPQHDREAQADSRGFTLWLTGLSGAGKSTLAEAITAELRGLGHRVEVLDGDEVRRIFGGDLGYTPADRATNMRRVGYVADLLSRNGVVAIAALMSPYRNVREEIREAHRSAFVEIFVDCALDELMRRDTKGLYARARAGTVQNMIGLTEAYEPSVQPDIHLHTDQVPIASCVEIVMAALAERGLVAGQTRT